MMQRLKDNFDPATMRQWRAVVIPQPYATAICERGAHVEIVSHAERHRGEVLICSSHAPNFPHLMCGATIGIAQLVDCIPVSEMTAQHWELTRIPRHKREGIKRGYALMLADARRVIEIPCTARRGMRTLYYDNDDITEYPRQVYLDDKAWRKMHKKDGKGRH